MFVVYRLWFAEFRPLSKQKRIFMPVLSDITITTQNTFDFLS